MDCPASPATMLGHTVRLYPCTRAALPGRVRPFAKVSSLHLEITWSHFTPGSMSPATTTERSHARFTILFIRRGKREKDLVGQQLTGYQLYIVASKTHTNIYHGSYSSTSTKIYWGKAADPLARNLQQHGTRRKKSNNRNLSAIADCLRTTFT